MFAAPLHAQFMCVLFVKYHGMTVYPDAVKEHSQHTIGVEFSSRTVRLGEKRIKLQVSEQSKII